MTARIRPWTAGGAVLPLILVACAASAQSVSLAGSTSLRYIELRPIVRDSVAVDETTGGELLRELPDGRVVRCVPGDAFCLYTRPGRRESTVPLVHDLEASAWGFGQGIQLVAHVRARQAWGGRDLWPGAGDAFDVLAAYAEIERDRLRVRGGRQWKVSGLGFYNFDGLAVAVRPAKVMWIEAYGGRSLLRGLNEPLTTEALASADELAPPAPGILAGFNARYRPLDRLAVSATYQVDYRDDGKGVYSELAVADGVLALRGGSVDGAVEMNVASNELNEASLRLRSPPVRRTTFHAAARRHRPYFDLWTIWGAFSPVGFDEVRGGATWASTPGTLVLRGETSYRRYDDSGQDNVADFRRRGWGLSSALSWAPRREWRFEGAYGVESGFGAARRDGHAGVVRRLGGSGTLAVQAMAFQRLEELRLGDGTVVGLGAELSLPVSARVRVDAGLSGYRHLEAGAAPAVDWTQRRASVRLSWTMGAEPGAAPAPRAEP